MKHFIIVLGCAVLVAALAFDAVQSNHNYQLNKDEQSVKTLTAQTIQLAKQQAEANSNATKLKEAESEVTTLQVQCQVGIMDYELLTTVQRIHGAEPSCVLPATNAVQ